jgi:hypothetical protein
MSMFLMHTTSRSLEPPLTVPEKLLLITQNSNVLNMAVNQNHVKNICKHCLQNVQQHADLTVQQTET